MRRLAPLVLIMVVAAVAGCGGDDKPAAPPSADKPGAAATSAPVRTPPVRDEARCAADAVARLSPERLVGQLVMVGTPVATPQTLGDAVAKYHLGGTFLAGRSQAPAATLKQGIAALQKSAGDIPLHVAADQEGGQVQTLKGPDFPLIPSAVKQGALPPDALRGQTAEWAKRLKGIGVTMDLAPVADTVPAGTADDNPPIGAFDRQYGSTPDVVAKAISTVVPAVQDSGVITSLKHFPGLGRVTANTDTSDKAVDATTTPDDPFLRPFAAGVGAGSAAVMISSARYPRLDPNNIAAFSTPVVTDLLRKRMGFTGLVISDDLGVAVAAASVPVGERAVRFVRAGGDMVLTVKTSDAAPMTGSLLAAVKADPAFAARAADAAQHVIRSKYRAGLMKPCG
jgi:beta-N-acetylhexosaminidase